MAMPIPENPQRVHLIGICGSAMSALATMLKHKGIYVQGSDEKVYPPASTLLKEAGIPVYEGFSERHISNDIDLVIVGNVVRITNPEFLSVARSTIPFISMSDALFRLFMKGHMRIALCGTHGKTTTTAMTTHILHTAGKEPGFFIGGIALNFQTNGRAAKEKAPFVIEGDEYDTALFDKRPKMLVYKPHVAAVTSMEFDHADIYPNFDAYKRQFEILAQTMPKDGTLILCADRNELKDIANSATCNVLTYTTNPNSAWDEQAYLQAKNIHSNESGTNFDIFKNGKPIASVQMKAWGNHNVQNALAAIIAAEQAGVPIEESAKALETFMGVKRRLEIRMEKNGTILFDDFAHHPTAVETTLNALRARYPSKRVIAVFDPRSNTSRRKVYQHAFAKALSVADLVYIKSPEDMWKIPEEERIDIEQLANELKANKTEAKAAESVDEIVEEISKNLTGNEVIIGLSNGGFGGFYEKMESAMGLIS